MDVAGDAQVGGGPGAMARWMALCVAAAVIALAGRGAVAADGVVLLDLGPVIDRHVPAAEIDDACARGDVDVKKWCAQSHCFFPGSRAIKKAAGLTGLPPLCPVT